MKKISILPILLFAFGISSFGCTVCNRQIQEGIYNSQFFPNLLLMLSAFFLLTIIIAIMIYLANKKHLAWVRANRGVEILSPVPLVATGIVLGVGLGGFADGIILHQILQTHEMLSNKIQTTDYVGKSVNMFWDGIFHAYCLLTTIAGVILLWKLLQRKDVNTSGRLLTGGLLTGWAVFNIVEGIIDHHILKLHNVLEYAEHPDIANYIFLGISVGLLIVGRIIIKKPYLAAYTHQRYS